MSALPKQWPRGHSADGASLRTQAARDLFDQKRRSFVFGRVQPERFGSDYVEIVPRDHAGEGTVQDAVRKRGVEPLRELPHWNLNPARLPVPPLSLFGAWLLTRPGGLSQEPRCFGGISLSPPTPTCDTRGVNPPCRCRPRSCSSLPASARSIPSRRLDRVVDVVVERGVITRVGPARPRSCSARRSARVIDGAGRWLLPGLRRPARAPPRARRRSTRRTSPPASRAAAAGGFTHVCAMPNTAR